MDRRTLIVTGLVTVGAAAAGPLQALAQTESRSLPPAAEAPPPPNSTPAYPTQPAKAATFSRDEIVNSVSDFLGVTAESAGAAVERIFVNNGRPTGYIAGNEGSGALVVGARYGKGLLYMKDREPIEVFWQGPSIGFDTGGNASRVFTLCYDLDDPNLIFQRFPGVEGAAYFIAGIGVNYQRAGGITLAPMRAGVGFRLGANIGYLSYSRKRNLIPF
jgi:hypothetical protein